MKVVLLVLIILTLCSCSSTVTGEIVAMYERGGSYEYKPSTTWVYQRGYTTWDIAHVRKQWFLEVKHDEGGSTLISQVMVDSAKYDSSYVGKCGNF